MHRISINVSVCDHIRSAHFRQDSCLGCLGGRNWEDVESGMAKKQKPPEDFDVKTLLSVQLQRIIRRRPARNRHFDYNEGRSAACLFSLLLKSSQGFSAIQVFCTHC